MKINDYYDNLIFSIRQELDQKAYSKYYNSCFEDDSEENFGIFNELIDNSKHTLPLTFNKWYGSNDHKIRINQLLRKLKLKQLQKIRNMSEE